MITRRTKIQLIVFVDHHAGRGLLRRRPLRPARPALLDDTYTVVAHFAESGGTFAGGEVTYRGVGVGQRREAGADRRRRRRLPRHRERATTTSRPTPRALVGNRSAVGEQYVELQPQSDGGRTSPRTPRSRRTTPATPIATDTLLTNLSNTVGVGRPAGAAHHGRRARRRPSPAPARTCRRSSTPAAPSSRPPTTNFDVTTALIRDGNTVLNGQIASESAIRTFATRPRRCSATPWPTPTATCARSSTTARATANQLRTLHRGQPRRARPSCSTTWSPPARSSSSASTASSSCWSSTPTSSRAASRSSSEVARHRPVRRPLRA